MRNLLLKHYDEELGHIRQMAAEFAREFPKIAGRLGLEAGGQEICPDPFVERLLEGFAFLTARVQVKFDAEFPRLTQSLLESVFPHYLAPTPSMLIAQFEPQFAEADLAGGYLIPRGTSLRGNPGVQGAGTPVQFQTAHPVTLWPLRIKEAQYISREMGAFQLPAEFQPKAILKLRFEITADVVAKDIKLQNLDLHLRTADGNLPYRLHEQILAHGVKVIVQSGSGRIRRTLPVDGPGLAPVGYTQDEALLPPAPRSFDGYRLLREYFAFPQRFLFFKLVGLRPALSQVDGREFDVLILFDEKDIQLEGKVDAAAFVPYCTPAINLFPKRLDRIMLSDRFNEYHVVADKHKPIDFEIFDLSKVTGVGGRSDEEQQFTPYYFNYDRDQHSKAYYTINRQPRTLSARELQVGPPRYTGSEVYMSIVDGNCAPFKPELQQLATHALCTNRHLATLMPLGSAMGKSDFYLDINAPVVSTRCLTTPSEPIPSPMEGELSWRMISHLSLNYLSLIDNSPEEGAAAMRELLRLYALHPQSAQANTAIKKMIGGLVSVRSEPIVRRALTPGPIAFARGLEVELMVRETEFSGSSAFLFGSVIERFLAKYVSINSFTETVLKSERGIIHRWVAQPGSRELL